MKYFLIVVLVLSLTFVVVSQEDEDIPDDPYILSILFNDALDFLFQETNCHLPDFVNDPSLEEDLSDICEIPEFLLNWGDDNTQETPVVTPPPPASQANNFSQNAFGVGTGVGGNMGFYGFGG